MRILLNNLLAVVKNQFKPYNKNGFYLQTAKCYCVSAETNKIKTQETEAVGGTLTKNEQEQRSLHIAVIGVPNAGKSTFINNLINHRVCPTSSKVHTTRNANKAILTSGNTQLVFYDTPGLVTQKEIKKHKLEQSFKSAYRHAVQNADIIAVMHDVSNSYARNELHATVMDTLKAYSAMPSFLVLNKIDTLKSKRVLLDLIRILTNDTLSSKRHKGFKIAQSPIGSSDNDTHKETGIIKSLRKRESTWSQFSDVFLVSSTIGSGLNDIQSYLLSTAKQRPWQYEADNFTDTSPETLVVDSVRARLLDYLPQEIPYMLKSVLEYYCLENNTVYASVQVHCPSTRLERLICGESNGRLRQITERVTSDLVETFGKPVSLTISTISSKQKN